jgi:hypothetical protein
MGFIRNIFGSRAAITQLPSGSITINRAGEIVTSTVSSAYPVETLQSVGREVLALFKEARTSQMPLAEISLHFASLRITARELRGGAIIFLFPQTALSHIST